MKQTPILFSTPMVQAILEGRKTQTRRTTGLEKVNENPSDWAMPIEYNYGPTNPDFPNQFWVELAQISKSLASVFKCPYGQPGDVLWVRETWCEYDKHHVIDSNYGYRANVDAEGERCRQDYIKAGYPYQWKPSIHMPKAAARIWLRVAAVRVERLQQITQDDAKAEGVKYHPPFAVQDFFNLWRTINGIESLEANPWVWVVTFEVLSTTGKPSNI